MKKNKICASQQFTGHTIQISAAAENSDLSKVTGLAYSGDKFKQYWFEHPLVTDIAGCEISAQIPLLYNHLNDPDFKLGELQMKKTETQLLIVSGGVDPETPRGKNIIAAGKKSNWQLSHGADPILCELVPEGETRRVNGRDHSGPFLHVVKSKLREVSVVAVGADSDTYLRIAASFTGNEQSINHNKQIKGAIMKKELIEFIRAKYSLGDNCDEAVITAHLAKINSSVEAETSDMAAQVSAKNESAKNEHPIQAAAGMTQAQIEAAAKFAAERAVSDARTAEAKRIEAVSLAAKDHPEIRDKAIAAGWSKEYTENVLSGVKAITAHIPSTGGNIIVRSGPVVDAKTIEAALCLQCGIQEKTIIASCGQSAIEIADAHLRGIGLKDVMVEAARIEGKNIGVGFSNETIRTAFSTVSLPGILSNVANKRSLQAFQAQESIAEQICSAGDLSDFKEAERYRITDIGDLEIVAEGGELKNGSLGEDKATNKLNTYGKVFTLTRQMIYNDDLGEFLKVPTAMGTRAKRKIDQIFFARLLANPVQTDGKALFSAEHKNYKVGATTALVVDSLEKALALFLDQVDADGQPIAVSPKFLLVPTCLYPYAQRLTTSTILVGGTAEAPAGNIISNYGMKPVASPYLSNSKYTGYSETGYYLFGDPNQVDTFEIGYFQGRRTPTVEKGETDFNTLGISFRVYFDFGIREQDHRGMVFFKGKA